MNLHASSSETRPICFLSPPVLHVPRRKHVANGFNFDRSTLESFAATRVPKVSSMFSNADALNFEISHREIMCNDSWSNLSFARSKEHLGVPISLELSSIVCAYRNRISSKIRDTRNLFLIDGRLIEKFRLLK